MWRCSFFALLVAAAPSMCFAQSTQERLLPSGSQVFLHWEGFARHQAAYEKTAVGKMMKGDMGAFVQGLVKYVTTEGQKLLASELNPEVAAAMSEELNAFFTTVGNQGFLIGVELRKVEPPEFQAVIVFPGGSGKRKSPLALINLGARMDPNIPLKKVEIDGRSIQHVQMEKIHMAWWAEGDDGVVAIGTDGPEALIKRIKEKGPSIADSTMYKQIKQFKEFPTWGRAFIDLPALGKAVGSDNKEVASIMDTLGLKSIKGITMHMGFDGLAERSVTLMHLDGKREGILKMLSKQSFSLKDLPPMPQDVGGFTASSVDAPALYDVVVEATRAILKLVDPNEAKNIEQMIQGVQQQLGVNIRDDLLASLGNLTAQYSTFTEGVLNLGQMNVIKVKDAEKLEKSLNQMYQAGLNMAPGMLFLKTIEYHGAKIHMLYVNDPSGLAPTQLAMTYTIHNGWLALSSYPQPVKGFVLRSAGKLPSWEPNAELKQILNGFPKEYTSITISDPRAGMKAVLAFMPLAVTAANAGLAAISPGMRIEPFDVSLIPNGYEATQHLFPNVTIVTDQGNTLRSETRSSLQLPF